MPHPLAKTERLLRQAAKLAKRKGINPRAFTVADLSNLYYRDGNPTPSQFLNLLKTTKG